MTYDGLLSLFQTSCFRRTSHGNTLGSAVCAKGSIRALTLGSEYCLPQGTKHSLPDVKGDRFMNFFSARELGVSIYAHAICELLVSGNQTYAPLNWKYSYSTPATGSHPNVSADLTALARVPRGHTGMGSWVSGSRNEIKKKGTLASQERRRYVAKSMRASISLYPLARLETNSSLGYTVSCISHPLEIPDTLNIRHSGTKEGDLQDNTAESKSIALDCA